jgi:hypothetical protein
MFSVQYVHRHVPVFVIRRDLVDMKLVKCVVSDGFQFYQIYTPLEVPIETTNYVLVG